MTTWETEVGVLVDDVIDVFGVSVTVSRVTAGTFTFATGARSGQSTLSDTVTAGRQRVTPSIIDSAGGGKVRMDDTAYYVKASALANVGTPDENTTVTDGGVVRRVVHSEKQNEGLAWLLVCRQVAAY